MNPFRLWVYRLLVHNLPETRCFGLKAILLRWCGAVVGSDVRISSSARFVGNGKLILGNDIWIGAECMVSSVSKATITIASHVDLGPRVMIITGTHEIDAEGPHIGGKGIALPVEIGEGCWLGAHSVILPGVKVAARTVVAAGAVVTRSITESHLLVAGIPATVKKGLGGHN